MYITPPRGGFPRWVARHPRGCQYRTARLRKALGEVFTMPAFLAPYDTDTIASINTINTVETSTMENRPRGCVMYTVTVVYGNASTTGHIGHVAQRPGLRVAHHCGSNS